MPEEYQPRPLPLRSGEAGTPLTAVDIAWLRMDDETNLMHVHGVFPLGGDVTWEQAAKPFAERMAKIPRFRHRVARDEANGGRLVWVDDDGFDLHRHLTEGQIEEPGDDAALARAVERHLGSAFDRAHPLWQFHLLHGYRGGSALFARVHHAIGDGIALMLVILALFDLAPTGPPAVEVPDDLDPQGVTGNPFLDLLLSSGAAGFARVEAALARIMPEQLRLMKGPAEAFARLHPLVRSAASTVSLGRLIARPSDPSTPLKGPLGVEKRVAWTERLPLDEVRQVGRQLGGTINDVLNTAMAGGLRRYLTRSGTPPESLGLRAAMPVSLRPLSEMADMGNRFGLIFLKLPVGMADPLRRLEELRRRSSALKRSTEPLVVFNLLKAAGALPIQFHRLLLAIFATKATAVFTNVPGPNQTLYFAGQPLRDIYFWVPQAGHLGLGVSILSYDGGVRMGVGTDAGLVPDPGLIVDGFHAEFEALATAAARR
jgi:diacylglycerol O-acyltransferase